MVALALLATVFTGLLPQTFNMATGAFDKIGFDLDVMSRQRETASIQEQTRIKYEQVDIQVNIAVWNVHVPEKHQFEGILDSGTVAMGKGGGFRVVVFTGKGYLRNNGVLGEENWRCSGRMV